MKTVKFKTNIKCEACLAKVSPYLEAAENVDKWEVDLKDPDRTLTVILKSDQVDEVIKAVDQAGFQASKQQSGWKFWQ